MPIFFAEGIKLKCVDFKRIRLDAEGKYDIKKITRPLKIPVIFTAAVSLSSEHCFVFLTTKNETLRYGAIHLKTDCLKGCRLEIF